MFFWRRFFIIFFLWIVQNTTYSAQVYLWKQIYNTQTKEALQCCTQNFDAVNFLSAKITFKNNKHTPILQTLPINTEYLKSLKINKIASIRIESLNASEKIYAKVSQELSKKITEHALYISKQTNAKEIQIDFDCPISKLANYAQWLKEIRKELPEEIKLSITAVISQMRAKNFKETLPYCDYFVLQIHNIANHSNKLKIFDFKQSVKAVLEADKFSKDFLVALPTYTHFVKLNNAKVEKIYSENFNANQVKELSNFVAVRSKPIDVANLRDTIVNLKLKNYKGEIFYRLPSGDEISNWSIATLVNVVKNRASKLKKDFKVFMQQTPYTTEIFLQNTGNIDIVAPLSVSVEIPQTNIYSEGVGDFQLSSKKVSDNSTHILFNATNICLKIQPSKKIKIGWIKIKNK